MSALLVNGVMAVAPGESLGEAEVRQRLHQELLRQAAQRAGMLAASDPAPVAGVPSEAAVAAIEALLERTLPEREPDRLACERYHQAHPARLAQGEQVQARHILFAVAGRVDLHALRARAEACLIDLRAAAPNAPESSGRAPQAPGAPAPIDRFAAVAREWSNCPSGADGGALGWLHAADCMPEFARELFGQKEVGVLPRLVRSRHGFHVVEVLARRPGTLPPFEAVQASIAALLRQQAFATDLRTWLLQLAEEADIEGLPEGMAA